MNTTEKVILAFAIAFVIGYFSGSYRAKQEVKPLINESIQLNKDSSLLLDEARRRCSPIKYAL